MSRRRIVIVIALAAGLALAVWVGAFVWPALNLRPAKVFTLPDGTAVMFYRATYDTNYEVAYGTGWRDHVAQLIPAHFRANLDLKVARVSAVTVSSLSGTTNPEMLVIWMKTLQPGSNAPPTAAASIAGSRGPAPRPATAAPRIRLNIVDDSGLEAAGINQGANGPLMPVIIPNFPRRSRTLHVRIRSLGNLSFSAGDNLPVIGDFDIPNPARRGGRVLTANPLPQSRTNNGVEVSLVRLETGHAYSDFAAQPAISPVTGQPLHGIAATGIFGTDSDAILKFKEDGRDTTSNWSVRFVYATTPAYPIPVRQNVIRSKLTPDGLLCPFGIALWPEDPVWDLTLEILRTTNFPPEELWTIPGIPVPQPGQKVALTAVTNINGAQFRLIGISSGNQAAAGIATRVNAGLVSGSTTSGATLSIQMQNCPPEVRLAVASILTNQGEQLQASTAIPQAPVTNTIVTNSNGQVVSQRTLTFSIKPIPNSQTIDATFSISQSRYLTFRVRPEMAK